MPFDITKIFSGGAGDLVQKIGDTVRSFVTTKGDVMKNDETLKELDAKILEMTNAHIEKMASLAQEQFSSELKDMADARNREIQIANSDKAPYINKVLTPILALIITALCFSIWYIVVFEAIPKEKELLVGGICGSVTTILMMVMAYYFGSSAGSKQKSEQLNKILGQ